MHRAPRAGRRDGQALRGDDGAQEAARRLVLALDESYLAIQRPPGSGKSTVGARMIVDLVAAGKRVGVTANSHKVIGELLEKTANVARERGIAVAIGQRPGKDGLTYPEAVHLGNNAEARDALNEGTLDVVGGTAWLWARDDMVRTVDVLFIDEAGQMSLADAIAASSCATNLVLLGDPQQLDQPLQGTHPPGAERSALGHVLDSEQVMPDRLGLFLDGTWRLHPTICAYTSEVFYAGRLHAHPGRESLAVAGNPPFDGAGIRFISVPHDGHSSESPEEAAAIAVEVRRLLALNPTWTDALGTRRPLTQADILIITPYNAQVAVLAEALPDFRIGTVDKFQGQEAPVSIYSMATSSAADAPRGMEFLYSLNRLNVATSRAQCVAAVVASRTFCVCVAERLGRCGSRTRSLGSWSSPPRSALPALRQFRPRPAAHHPKGGGCVSIAQRDRDRAGSYRSTAILPARARMREASCQACIRSSMSMLTSNAFSMRSAISGESEALPLSSAESLLLRTPRISAVLVTLRPSSSMISARMKSPG